MYKKNNYLNKLKFLKLMIKLIDFTAAAVQYFKGNNTTNCHLTTKKRSLWLKNLIS